MLEELEDMMNVARKAKGLIPKDKSKKDEEKDDKEKKEHRDDEDKDIVSQEKEDKEKKNKDKGPMDLVKKQVKKQVKKELKKQVKEKLKEWIKEWCGKAEEESISLQEAEGVELQGPDYNLLGEEAATTTRAFAELCHLSFSPHHL